MKMEEIIKLSTEDLDKKIKESKKELFELRLKQAVGNLEKPSQIKELRKSVARMKTIQRERELEKDKGKDDKNE